MNDFYNDIANLILIGFNLEYDDHDMKILQRDSVQITICRKEPTEYHILEEPVNLKSNRIHELEFARLIKEGHKVEYDDYDMKILQKDGIQTTIQRGLPTEYLILEPNN